MTSQLTEVVDLPDPAIQPLVHPLDLPEARKHFRRSWIIESTTGLGVAVCLAGVLWFIAGGYLVPLIAGLVLVVLGRLAANFSAREAWAHIPRSRQDKTRVLPWTWRLGSGVALAVVLTAALILTALRLDREEVEEPVRAFGFGMGATAALLVAADQIVRLIRRRQEAVAMLPGTVAVLVAAVVAYTILFDSAQALTAAPTLWGAGSMAVCGLIAIALEARTRAQA